jgi:hypothetical protein
MGTNQKTNLANSSNMGPLSQVSAFTFVVNIFVNLNHPVPERECACIATLSRCVTQIDRDLFALVVDQ